MIKAILEAYDWYDHPEGPKFVETHRNQFRTSGHWLFLPGAISSFHKVLNSEEIWAIHQGKLILHTLESNGEHRIFQLGTNLKAGELPVITIPKGCLQAAEIPDGVPFAFGSNICAPAFTWEQLDLVNREELLHTFPQHSELITRLTK
ncbi:MAG: cupin domain-containing protein [Spirulinaceae cyanobacterium]